MILFVFEGEERETGIFRTLEHLFFRGKEDRLICSYGNNIYNLYAAMTDDGNEKDENFFLDIVSVMKSKLRDSKDNPLAKIESSDDISEI